jgi:hypothetical protein
VAYAARMAQLAATAAALEDLVVVLVQGAPEIDRAVLEAAARAALAAATFAVDTESLVRLALVIERVIDDLGEGEIALGVGLPAVAMAAYSLRQAIAAGAAADPLAIQGAVYELETMTPVPSTGRRPTVDEPVPDVPLAQLTSKLPVTPVRRPDTAAPARARRLAAIAATTDDAVLAAVGAARARYDRS